ncbi:MAG TPA: hypothetical protein VF283_01445 [Bryobacteraceae bacterium]
MRLGLSTTVLLALAAVSTAQDPHNWNSLGQLKTGDQVRISLTGRSPLTGAFRNWSPDQVTIADMSLRKKDVLQVQRYRRGVWSRGKRAAIGALIGFGSGFALGAAVIDCGKAGPNSCSRAGAGASGGAVGAVIGAAIGAALPHHNRELIYSAK